MRQRRMTAIAVACGLACALCIGAFMASVQGQADSARAEALARYGGEQVEVCVATRDIAAGERVDVSSVEAKLWVADLLPEDALRTTGDVVGKVATSSILKGEVVSGKRFESDRDSLDVPAGKQAVSVPVKAVQAVGGAVRPGMSVDVYSSGDTTTTALVKGVVVLDTSVGDKGSLVSSDSGWITLAVDADRVQELIAAAARTSLYIVLPGEQAQAAPASGEREPGEPAAGEREPIEAAAGEQQAGEPASEVREPIAPAAGEREPGEPAVSVQASATDEREGTDK